MSALQFAKDNNVYFEFFPTYCLVIDILTKEILLQGDAVRGLYRFNVVIIGILKESKNVVTWLKLFN